MKRNILILLFTLLMLPAFATQYFVDSINGSDTNNGTSAATPFKTLAKLTSMLVSGDEAYLARGGKWYGESITVPASNITISTYGIGEKPKIYSSELITGWSVYSGNIYQATTANNVQQLSVNDERMRLARYPNTGWFSITSVGSTTQFTSTDITSQTTDYYKDATVHIKTNAFRLDNKLVTASTGQTLTIDSPTSYGLGTGQDFIMVNKLEFLDEAGEWYCDTTTNTVYLWTEAGDSPINYTVLGASDNVGISVSSKDSITVENIQIYHSLEYAIQATSCNKLTIDNCNLIDGELQAISMSGDSATITNNYIQGFNYIPFSASSAGGTFSNNKIYNTAIFDNLGLKGMNGFSYAMSLTGAGLTAEYNTIENAGFMGLVWTAQNAVIRYNYVTSISQILTDGGGIYTYSSDVTNELCKGSILSYNIFVNDSDCVSPIYMDERTNGVAINNNTVIETDGLGIFLHDTKNCIVRNNTLFKNSTGFRVTYTHGGNVFKENIVVEENTAHRMQKLNEDETATLVSDSNQYVNHFHIYNFYNTKTYSDMSFSGWQTTMGQDANSTLDGTALGAGEVEVIFYNITKDAETQDLTGYTWRDIDGNSVSSLVLQPFTSQILIRE